MPAIHYTGKWALITGASAGIGAEFARRFAREGANLVLTARREDRLASLARELQHAHAIRIEIIPADLAENGAPEALFAKVKALGISVSVLVNNAGFGVYGRLDETPLEQNQKLIRLNVHAMATLTQLFLPDMLAAREGFIFHLASIAAFQPVAYMSNYAASKAYVLSFSEALWAEYRARGVRVLAVCPGATKTEFFDVMGSNAPAMMGNMDTAQGVMERAMAAMARGKSSVICGSVLNHLMAFMTRLSPRALTARIGERLLRKHSSGT